MTIRARAAGLLLAAATTAALVGMAATPAMAATTLHVKVTGGGAIRAVANKTVLSDHGINVTCTSTKTKKASTASGTIPNGTRKGTAPVKVGVTPKLAFNNCVGPLGKVTTHIHSLPYLIKVDSKTTRTGKTDGIITGVNVSVSMTGCSFKVTGSTPGYYDNRKHQLVVTTTNKLPTKPLVKARLRVSGVSGCAGLVKNGDHPTYVSTYAVSRKVVIKSS